MKISKSVLVLASLALLAAGSYFAVGSVQNQQSTPKTADGGAPYPPIPPREMGINYTA
jgi:hypothetical protein